ncbi:27553_t:CDS:1, partial [Gigaspora margarita]
KEIPTQMTQDKRQPLEKETPTPMMQKKTPAKEAPKWMPLIT